MKPQSPSSISAANHPSAVDTSARLQTNPARDEPPSAAGTQKRSLFGEILDWMLAPLFLLWPMSIAITYVVAQDIANAPFDRHLQSALQILTHQIDWTTEHNTAQNANTALPTVTLSHSAKVAMRTQETAGTFWKAQLVDGPLLGGESALPVFSMPADWRPGDVFFRDESIRGHNLRIAYTWVRGPNETDTPVFLMTAEGTENRADLANKIIKGVIIPQFLVLPLAVLLVWFGLSRGIAPIRALQQRLRSRHPDDLSAIDASTAPTEITPLVVAMNDLLSRLAVNIESQRRFVADAAHQLKTPLAGLRAQAELTLKTTTNPETVADLHKIVASTERATRLMNQLLLMANAEHVAPVAHQVLDLNNLARHTCEHWVPHALEAGIDLGFEASEDTALIHGEPILLAEALNNLIDNALRYVPANGQVTVGVNTTPSHVELTVRDNGPGIHPDDQARVFDRFYRVLGSTRHGSGLGLAIVKEIAQRHKATVSITDADTTKQLRGARFTLTFERIISE